LEEKVSKLTEETIERTIKDGLTTSNLDIVYKLVDIYKDIKEVECMNYGEYNGRGPGHGSYGEYNRGYGEYGNYGNYGRRGYDSKYRGHDSIDRMSNEYGRYMENRERYGANEDTDRSFHYMVKALEDFIKVLYEEAETEPQKQQLRQALQNSMR